ncbi:MAG TPA: selenocysteine-specific translation elongation factor [Gemmatimonadales bacterium]|nr:selenocysteine-specific translation elongation factor [Gemmatimonadales bacterium]
MIIGMAGHIDHGKSTLVEALTAKRMDRLAEERARGITIDLNFAPLRLADGEIAGVVDVPGHEDFVRTMVAGAAGVDLVLLVIAADEGIKPQTREHLAIVEALGVPRGVAVLTKCDRVDADRVALAQGEVQDWLKNSPVAFVGALPVSARTGAGLGHLLDTVQREAAVLRPRDESAPFRMPIDRAFSLPGAGTIVTGSVWSGSAGPGDALRLLPAGRSVRVRAVEVHGTRSDCARPGNRAALGLFNVERDQVGRGDVLVDAALPWEPTTALDVRLQLLQTAPRPLTSRTSVHLHLGTTEVVARVLPRAPIPPGGVGLARLICEAPVVARGGDRFVIRSYSPVSTIGGGVVLDPTPPRRRALWPGTLGSSNSIERLGALLERHPAGASSASLAFRSGLATSDVEGLLAGEARVRLLPGGWVMTAVVDEARRSALEALSSFHGSRPAQPGMPVETLRRGIHRSAPVAEAAVADLAAGGAITIEAGLARLAGFEARIAGGPAAVDRVVAAVRTSGFAAPPVRELERQFEQVDVMGALRLAAGAGQVEAVTPDWYLAREVLDGFRATLQAEGRAGQITVTGVRNRTGLSRKYLIPLLEWADRRGITRREGDARRLT